MRVSAVSVLSVLAGSRRVCGPRAATIAPVVMSASTHEAAGTAGGAGTPGLRLTMTPLRVSSSPPTVAAGRCVAEAAAGDAGSDADRCAATTGAGGAKEEPPGTPTAPVTPSRRLSARARTVTCGWGMEGDDSPPVVPAGPQTRPGQTRRVMSARLTSWIALVTSMPRGQASVQLKVVRQRHTPSLSLRISRRCLAAVVAAVEDEAVRVDDRGRAEVLAVGPEDRAGRGARGAEDALGGVVEAVAVGSATGGAPWSARGPLVIRKGMTSR